jgi:hypothetical protein
MSTNPFTFGNPIRDPARFYGRVEDIRQIVNRLRSSAHESTSVVGEWPIEYAIRHAGLISFGAIKR